MVTKPSRSDKVDLAFGAIGGVGSQQRSAEGLAAPIETVIKTSARVGERGVPATHAAGAGDPSPDARA
jgi:hypothetical protein